MEKFDSFFKSLNISESSLQSIKDWKQLDTNTSLYIRNTIPVLYVYILYYYTHFLHWKHSNFKKNALRLSIFVLRNVGNFEVHMSAEDDIFFAEASPIADRRKLPLYHIICVLYIVILLNKKSITMCDVSRGGGLQRNEHMTFLMDKIDMRGFPKGKGLLYICSVASLFFSFS
jgi:hypothetical protein